MVQLMQGEDDPLKISNQLKIFCLVREVQRASKP